MKSQLLALGLLLGAAAHAEGPYQDASSAPAMNSSSSIASVPNVNVQAASPKTGRIAQEPTSTPAVQARMPGPADLCRAGMALAKGRKLPEMTIHPEKGGVFAASYVPWPNAPADARAYKCKVAGNTVVSGEVRGRKVKWKGERVSWSLAPKVQELTVHISYNTGKGRSRTHTFWELEHVCNGCEGFQAAPVIEAKAAATVTTKRQ